MSAITDPFESFTLTPTGTVTYATASATTPVFEGIELGDASVPLTDNYISLDEFHAKHNKQMNPPPGGWKNGSRVMCAMRQKNTGEYFPRVLCYVHIEKTIGGHDDIYLIQKCCKGSEPMAYPEGYAGEDYVSWTIRSGSTYLMRDEQVAYLGPCEGRNAL